jgi:hypothetical protein
MDLHLLRTIGVDLSHDGSEIALSDEQTWSASAELEPSKQIFQTISNIH